MSLTNDTAKVDYITESISQELFDEVEVLSIEAENLKIRYFKVTRGETWMHVQYIIVSQHGSMVF